MLILTCTPELCSFLPAESEHPQKPLVYFGFNLYHQQRQEIASRWIFYSYGWILPQYKFYRLGYCGPFPSVNFLRLYFAVHLDDMKSCGMQVFVLWSPIDCIHVGQHHNSFWDSMFRQLCMGLKFCFLRVLYNSLDFCFFVCLLVRSRELGESRKWVCRSCWDADRLGPAHLTQHNKTETRNNDRRRERDTAVQSSAAIPKCRIRLTDGAALQVSGVGLRLWDMCPLVYRVTATVRTAAEMKEQHFFFSGAGFLRRRNDWR